MSRFLGSEADLEIDGEQQPSTASEIADILQANGLEKDANEAAVRKLAAKLASDGKFDEKQLAALKEEGLLAE